MTIAAHGFLGGSSAVYQPQPRLGPNRQLDNRSRIANVSKIFGKTDLAIAELRQGINYSSITLNDIGDAPAPPFRNLAAPKDVRMGDTVYINTPFNGQSEGAHLYQNFERLTEDDGSLSEPIELKEVDFVYFGNGSDYMFEGCCGGVIWDKNFHVISQYRYQSLQGEKLAEAGGSWRKLAYAPTFGLLVEAGFCLSTV